ncbi:hypothetical protein PDTK01_05910, partial [Phycicoccus sp. DTK01]
PRWARATRSRCTTTRAASTWSPTWPGTTSGRASGSCVARRDAQDDAVGVPAAHHPLDAHDEPELEPVLGPQDVVCVGDTGLVLDQLGPPGGDRRVRLDGAASRARAHLDARVAAQTLDLAAAGGRRDEQRPVGVGRHPDGRRDGRTRAAESGERDEVSLADGGPDVGHPASLSRPARPRPLDERGSAGAGWAAHARHDDTEGWTWQARRVGSRPRRRRR